MKIKKILGSFVILWFGLFAISSILSLISSLTGQIETSSFGERIANTVGFSAFAIGSLKMVQLGVRMFTGKNGKSAASKVTGEKTVVPAKTQEQDQGISWKLDHLYFPAYPLEKRGHDILKDKSSVLRSFLVKDRSADVLVNAYIREKGATEVFSNGKNRIHFRVLKAEDADVCQKPDFCKQCLDHHIHIVMHTGPYTLYDFTEKQEYCVKVTTKVTSAVYGEWRLETANRVDERKLER